MAQEGSVAFNMNKYCTKQPCTLCPCGKYEFPECVDKLKAQYEEAERQLKIMDSYAEIVEVE